MSPSPKTAPRRADALRSIDAIVAGAAECLSRDPDASLTEIAKVAGVGRVTLYAHFGSRAEVVDAAMVRVIERGNAVLETVDLTGDPRQALDRLIEASWQLLDQTRSLLVAAQRELTPGRIRDLHAEPAARVENLVARGRGEGVFRTDLPISWLVNVLHTVLNSAAAEILAGRLNPEHAPAYISATVLAAFTPPGHAVPGPGNAAAGRRGPA